MRQLLLLLSLLVAPVAAQADPPKQGSTPQDTPRSAQGSRGGAAPSDDAFEMGSPPQLADGLTEEDMWPAATAEGWKKPVLVKWQRSFEDALSVANAENRPLLVAVNMDGEIASEHFAGIRYRDPTTSRLMSRYSCVIASVYRHTPRDYDEEGRRIPCPRFGTVTCGEHIQAERELYAKYFDGRRISPRHIVIDPRDQSETLDVYFSWDTQTVFTTFEKGVEGWPEPEESREKTLEGRAQSADVADREELERVYATSDVTVKREILRTLAEKRVVDQVEVLREAIFGLDLELARLARRALAECETDGALDLMAEALKVPLDESERQMLLDAVVRLSATSPRARTLAALHSGLGSDSSFVDPTLVAAREGYETSRDARGGNAAVLSGASVTEPSGPDELLELAEALVAQAYAESNPPLATLLFRDAKRAAQDAKAAGAEGPRLDGILAVVASRLGERGAARDRAVAAVEGGLLRSDDGEFALDDRARAEVLRQFVDARRSAIRRAYRGTGEWPPQWLADIGAAYEPLRASGQVTEIDLVRQQDFLRWVGASARADELLEWGLARFPDSGALHERLRSWLLWKGGPAALEDDYRSRMTTELAGLAGPQTQIAWFSAYASLVAAEQYRRRSEFGAALEAYDRSVRNFRLNVESFPDSEDTTQHYVALALAGKSRVLLEQGDLANATDALERALSTRPDSAASLDGLGITPIATAKMLRSKLEIEGDAAGAAKVQAALDALDPELLEPPPSEQRVGRRGRQGGR
ncbi:MAG: hypothetical protein AAGA20_11765 [Planctomycetota bacterium]